MITGPGRPDFAPETYLHCLGCSSYRLSSMLLKTVLVEFWRLFRARAPLEHVSGKSVSNDSVCFRNIPTYFVVIFILYPVRKIDKCFGRILTTFPVLGTTAAGKVKNLARRTRFCTRNIPTLLGCNSYHFSSVRSKNVSVEFWLLFGSGHHWSKKSWKPASYDSVYLPKHTNTFLGCSSYRFPWVRLENVSV